MLPAILTVVAHSKFINFDASKADKQVLLIVYLYTTVALSAVVPMPIVSQM